MDGTFSALIFMAAGAAMSVLREAPRRAGSWLADLFSISVAVDEDDPVHWFATWLAKQPYGGRCRRLKLWIKWRHLGDYGEESTVSRVELEPGLGPHLFRYRGRWFLLTREEQQQQRAHSSGRTRVHLRTFGRTRRPLAALVEEVVEHGIRAMREQNLVRVNDDGGSWRMLEAGEARRLESVVLSGDERAQVLADMQRFLGRREWYASRGIPYRRGYLFFGLPGSGKTSLARSLASELGLTLFMLDLSSSRTSDQQLFSLLAQVPPRSMVLVEDVDRTRALARPAPAEADQQAAAGGVTIAGLLNAVDGPTSGEGRVLVFTTNHPDGLDPALLRPGRVDYRLEFRAADRGQARDLFLRFFPDELAGADAFAAGLGAQAFTMADLQGILLAANTEADAVALIARTSPHRLAAEHATR